MKMENQAGYLPPDILEVISGALDVETGGIRDIMALKKGMTNSSFLFTCNGKKYIIRIPGKGTDKLINRQEEAAVYQAVSGRHICDEIVYLDSERGYKITEFLEGARVCNPYDRPDLIRCMAKLRAFHSLELSVAHGFDLFGQIRFYESLWAGMDSAYTDYADTRNRVLELERYICSHVEKKVLSHIDAVPDNFLIAGSGVRLIDWEYAGMQDPHVDIAMFCIYSLYTRHQVDDLIDLYFLERCPEAIRIKIYAYIAVCGLLWSNWCEYKRKLGTDFGEYALRQYSFARDYEKIVREKIPGRR